MLLGLNLIFTEVILVTIELVSIAVLSKFNIIDDYT
jgi:hypothetical protein